MENSQVYRNCTVISL